MLNEYVCSDFNREGQLCGKCKNGFAPSVYSYSLRCVKISNYRYKWIKYIGIAFGPLTIFFLFISVLHISPTSPYLHGFIFYSHIISLPMNSRLITLTYEYHHSHQDPSAFTFLKLLLSVFGFWSLDFFRLFYNPFCIHPSMTTLHALALDYVIAVYPLLLLVLTYLMIKLHSRRCRLVVFLWRLFRPLLRILQSKLSIKTSLIDSFATVFLLSTIKYQTVLHEWMIRWKTLPIFGRRCRVLWKGALTLWHTSSLYHGNTDYNPSSFNVSLPLPLLSKATQPLSLQFSSTSHIYGCFSRKLQRWNK